ncbi:hypothetical protein [Flavobacterium sp. LC2016-01]|uniref:hypothetical protein n=1 Tax=Flavobacterium sp. LC2016-01 TaxID=2675876 RepID=UPI0012BACCD2|nr:hypothetical protein [Flavobacterium sp. LC2016-01]MTH15898.1 hypothetical protein [Flavobacterium sp. LC2016-01]
MKNVFKIGLPMAVAALGLASAASTSSISGGSKPVNQMGYRHISNPDSCNAVQECDEDGEWICKAPDNVTQLFEQDCLTPLKRSTP